MPASMMDPRLRELIDHNKLHAALIRQIGLLLPAEDGELDAMIGEAVAGHDVKAFNFITIAALTCNRPVDSRHLVGGTALTGNGNLLCCLAWKMHGEVAEHLVRGIQTTAMNRQQHASALLLAAKWSLEFREGRLPPDLVSEARLLARAWKVDKDRMAFLWPLAELLDDSNLKAVLCAEMPRLARPRIIEATRKVGEALLAMRLLSPMDFVPDKTDNLIGSGLHVRRAVARVGRNETCPCGSGKKYKRCCEEKDRDRMRHSSDVAGKTLAEAEAEPEPHLTEAKLKSMTPAYLARLDAAKIPPKLYRPYFMYLSGCLMADELATAFEKLGCGTKELEEAWNFSMFFVTMKQRLDVARRMMKVRYPDGSVPDTLQFDTRLLLARDDLAHSLELIEAEARVALTSTDVERVSGFAYGLMISPFGCLGIHCARSLIPLINKKNALFLMDQVHTVRDRLNLSSDEPFGEILEKRFAEEVADGGKDAAELRKARERVEAKATEVSQLKESLEKLRREIRLQEKKTPAPAPAQVAIESPELRGLRDKLRELKSSIAERNSERAAYRRELGQAYAELEALRARQVEAQPTNGAGTMNAIDAEDALLLPGEIDTNQPPRQIEFPRRFQDTLNHLPRQVGRAALMLIGRIAAGDPSAFAGAIRLSAKPDVMRVRVGMDHRMLFRLLPECVQLVALINRRDLDKTIASI